MDEQPNLVLGVIRGYTFEQLRPFVMSFARVRGGAELVLLWNSVDPDTRAALQAHGVKLVPIAYRGSGAGNSWRRFWPLVAPLARHIPGRFGPALLRYVLPLQTSRFMAYRDYLAAHERDYRSVLLTDVRDVVFQADPFERFDGRLTVFEEDADVRLADDTACNAAWVEDSFGPAALEAVGQYPILCSGTILGSARVMLEYLSEFEKLLLLRPEACGWWARIREYTTYFAARSSIHRRAYRKT